jgi:hypothetical protein
LRLLVRGEAQALLHHLTVFNRPHLVRGFGSQNSGAIHQTRDGWVARLPRADNSRDRRVGNRRNQQQPAADRERVRRDIRSGAALGCATLAGLMACLCIIGLGQHGPRGTGNPFALVVLPFVWWAVGLGGYKPRFVRMLRPALVLAVVVSLASLGAAAAVGRDGLELWIVSTAITIVSAAASEFLYRGSLLYRESPPYR